MRENLILQKNLAKKSGEKNCEIRAALQKFFAEKNSEKNNFKIENYEKNLKKILQNEKKFGEKKWRKKFKF